jgi:hypothetical protein
MLTCTPVYDFAVVPPIHFLAQIIMWVESWFSFDSWIVLSITDSKFLCLTLSFCYHSYFQITKLFVDQTGWFNHRKFCVQFYLHTSCVETKSTSWATYVNLYTYLQCRCCPCHMCPSQKLVWCPLLLVLFHLAFNPQSTFVVYVKKNYWFWPEIGWESSCFGWHHFLCMHLVLNAQILIVSSLQ